MITGEFTVGRRVLDISVQGILGDRGDPERIYSKPGEIPFINGFCDSVQVTSHVIHFRVDILILDRSVILFIPVTEAVHHHKIQNHGFLVATVKL